jgi:hypothetical protein
MCKKVHFRTLQVNMNVFNIVVQLGLQFLWSTRRIFFFWPISPHTLLFRIHNVASWNDCIWNMNSRVQNDEGVVTKFAQHIPASYMLFR